MPISEPYEQDALSVTTTELSLVSGTSSLQTVTDDGVYQLWIDVKNTSDPLAKGEELTIKILEKVEGTGGVKDVVFKAVLSDAQSEIFVTPMLVLMNGWDMTVQLAAGTITLDASIRKVA